jgi:hypothetical protein
MEKVDVELIVGLINENRNKTKRQFSLSRQAIKQLEYIFSDMKKNRNQNSYSAIIEQALNAYHSLYMFTEKLEKERKRV